MRTKLTQLLALTDMTWEKSENKLLEKYEFKTDPEKVVSLS